MCTLPQSLSGDEREGSERNIVAPPTVFSDLIQISHPALTHCNGVCGWPWETEGRASTSANSGISSSLVCRKNVDMGNISERILPSLLSCKGDGGEMYFQTCKPLLLQFYNKVESPHLCMLPVWTALQSDKLPNRLFPKEGGQKKDLGRITVLLWP